MIFSVGDGPGLSNPRAPSTTRLPQWFRGSIPGRHKLLYPRMVDRGALRPMQGEAPPIVPGTHDSGGIPRGVFWQSVFHYRAGTPIERMSHTAAKRATLAADLARRRAIMLSRPGITLQPGLGGYDVAVAPRWVPDTPSRLRGVLRDFRNPTERGIMYGDRVAPSGTRLLDVFRLRQTAVPTKTFQTDPRPSADRVTSLIKQSLRTDAAQTDTPPDNTVLYLAGAVFVAWLILR